jgi:hypothetical protein
MKITNIIMLVSGFLVLTIFGACGPKEDVAATINAAIEATNTAEANFAATVNAAVEATRAVEAGLAATADAAVEATKTAEVDLTATADAAVEVTSTAEAGLTATASAAAQGQPTASPIEAPPTSTVDTSALSEEELNATIDAAVAEAVAATEEAMTATAAAASVDTITYEETLTMALTIYLRGTLAETDLALSSDQPNGGMIYKEGQFVYGEAAVQIGDTVYHFDKPEVGPGEPEQLPDPWRVEFEFAEELLARTGNAAGFDPKKAQFWVGALDSHSAVGEESPYSLTMKLYEENELRESLQVFFAVEDAPEPGRPAPPYP